MERADSSRPVTLDEVQRTPSLFLAVKRAVDERRRAGDFPLTGSANLLLMGRVADTLAGRAIYLELPPSARPNGNNEKTHFCRLTASFPPMSRPTWSGTSAS